MCAVIFLEYYLRNVLSVCLCGHKLAKIRQNVSKLKDHLLKGLLPPPRPINMSPLLGFGDLNTSDILLGLRQYVRGVKSPKPNKGERSV